MIKKRIIIPSDWLLGLSLVYLAICEYLPIMNLLPPLLLSAGRVVAIAVFLLFVIIRDSRMGLMFAGILIITLITTIWAYYNCWINYTTIGSFLLKNLLCWVYMEVGVYLLQYGTEGTKKFLKYTILSLVCITAVTSLLVLRTIPDAVRELGNGSMHIDGTETILFKRNTCTWGELYSMAFLLPFLIVRYKQERKLSILLIIGLLEICIIASQITTAIIISVGFLVFLFLKPLSLKQMASFGVLFIVVGMIVLNYAADFFMWLYSVVSKTGSSTLTLRTYQLYVLFSSNKMIGTIGGRFDLYQTSWETFLTNPLWGYKLRNVQTFSYIGLHSQILDLMAATGLMGFVPLMISFISLYSSAKHRIQNTNVGNYFFLSVIMLIILMLTNPTYYASSIYMSVFCGLAIISNNNTEIQATDLVYIYV